MGFDRLAGWAAIFLFAASPVLSVKAARLQPETPATLCTRATARFERGSQLPPQLLSVIALVETGRRDPSSGAMGPWPWAINVSGKSFFFTTKEQAIATTAALQAQGVQSIDVGCMQVNLFYHPHAFASLDAAFDPQANVVYAARFLRDLFAQTGTWPKAVAAYHSQTPEFGADYLHRVMALWPAGREYDTAGPPELPTQYTPELARRVAADRAVLQQVLAGMHVPAIAEMGGGRKPITGSALQSLGRETGELPILNVAAFDAYLPSSAAPTPLRPRRKRQVF